ncbi:MAG: tyrosine-type recombinase/integrase [Desulfococcaceae bacterium]
MKKEPGDVQSIRAKRKPHIPVVPTKKEVAAVIRRLPRPYNLVVQVLYGRGLRLFECLQLRVGDFNFEAGIPTIQDGKGKKDRTVPLPETIRNDLLDHRGRVANLHQKDLADGYAGGVPVWPTGNKYKNAAKEFVWQCFFPAKRPTLAPDAGEYRRHHLHERHVQKELKKAVGKTRICKRVTCHGLRHGFAAHLLEANYDIRAIQELLGHSDVRTTMIYTRVAKSRTVKEAKKPAGFMDRLLPPAGGPPVADDQKPHFLGSPGQQLRGVRARRIRESRAPASADLFEFSRGIHSPAPQRRR